MSKPKVDLLDVRFATGKRMVAKFLELVDTSTLKHDTNPKFNKKRQILKCSITFMYMVVNSWKNANELGRKLNETETTATLSIQAVAPSQAFSPGFSVNTPTIPALHVKVMDEDDTLVYHQEKLSKYNVQCLCIIAQFLGIELRMSDFEKKAPGLQEKVSMVMNTVVWYTHLILIAKGGKKVKGLSYKVKTNETPTSEQTVPFTYKRREYLDPFLQDFCHEDFFH